MDQYNDVSAICTTLLSREIEPQAHAKIAMQRLQVVDLAVKRRLKRVYMYYA